MLALIALLNQLRYGQRDDSSAAPQSVVNPGPHSSKLNILHPLHATRKNWWNFDFFLFTSPTWNVDLLYGQVNFPPPPNLFVLQPTFSIWAQTHPTQRNGTFCNCIWFVASSLSFSVPPADSLQINPATLFDPLALKAAQTWSAWSNLTGTGKAAFWSEKGEGCSSLSCQQSFQLCSEWCAFTFFVSYMLLRNMTSQSHCNPSSFSGKDLTRPVPKQRENKAPVIFFSVW